MEPSNHARNGSVLRGIPSAHATQADEGVFALINNSF